MLAEILRKPLLGAQQHGLPSGIPKDGCEYDLVCLRNLSRHFGNPDAPAVNKVDLCVHAGEILAILGPSGSGKSTLLRLIAGFETPDAGSVLINHSVASTSSKVIAPETRGIGMVFQDYALFPHLSVFKNISFGLKGKLKGDAKRARVAEMINLMGLSGLEDRFPSQLSGGQQQRVALARALAPQPVAIMLDEPFSNLDYNMRKEMRKDLSRILHACRTTAVLVTHDREEAMSVADRIAVLHEGQLVQVDTPLRLYSHPKTPFAASLLGSANFITGEVTNSGVTTFLGEIHMENPRLSAYSQGEIVNVLIRPEHLFLKEAQGSVNGVVLDVDYTASQSLYEVLMHDKVKVLVSAPLDSAIRTGATVEVSADLEQGFTLFPLE